MKYLILLLIFQSFALSIRAADQKPTKKDIENQIKGLNTILTNLLKIEQKYNSFLKDKSEFVPDILKLNEENIVKINDLIKWLTDLPNCGSKTIPVKVSKSSIHDESEKVNNEINKIKDKNYEHARAYEHYKDIARDIFTTAKSIINLKEQLLEEIEKCNKKVKQQEQQTKKHKVISSKDEFDKEYPTLAKVLESSELKLWDLKTNQEKETAAENLINYLKEFADKKYSSNVINEIGRFLPEILNDTKKFLDDNLSGEKLKERNKELNEIELKLNQMVLFVKSYPNLLEYIAIDDFDVMPWNAKNSSEKNELIKQIINFTQNSLNSYKSTDPEFNNKLPKIITELNRLVDSNFKTNTDENKKLKEQIIALNKKFQ